MPFLLRDLKISVRHLLQSPGFAITAVLMLAFGIGATTAIFSIVEGVLLRPLPYPGSHQLVALGDLLQGSTWEQPAVTAPEVRDYMRDTRSFTHLGGYQQTDFELSGVSDPVVVHAARMSAEVFQALGVGPLLGRVFTQREDEERQQMAVLSYGMWRDRFHSDPGILGTKFLLDRKPYMVIGVIPRGFEFPLMPGHLNRSDLWVPLSLTPEELTTGTSNWNFQMIGRLKTDVTVAEALGDAGHVAEQTMRAFPGYMHNLRIRPEVKPLEEATVEQARPLIRMLFLAVVVVLLIACANLAGLLLVRAIRRRREIAVRMALGARAATLLRQAILESLVLSVTGGALGLALAAAAVRLGVSLLPETLPRVSEIGLDWPVVGFAIGVAVLTGILCGLAPAFAAVRTNVNEALKEGGRTGSVGGGHTRLRSALVIAEVAVAMVLLTASGMLLRSFERMRAVDLGFRPDHTLVASYALPRNQYATQSAVDEFNESLLGNVRELSGVEAVGIASLLPAGTDDNDVTMTFEGYVPPKGAGLNMATPTAVKGDFFEALGVRLLRGRLFTDADDAHAQLVAIVNRKLAEHYWPGQDPVGKRLHRGMAQSTNPWLTVVGEVDDVKMGSPDGRTAEQIYQPVAQWIASRPFAAATELSGSSGYIVLRTVVPPEQMENALRAAVRKIDSQLPLYEMQTMEHAISGSEAPRRFNTTLISSFAVVALLLSILGISGVTAFSVALREQEMAIRMALGSRRSGVLNLILAAGLKLAAVGSAFGLLGAIAISRLLRSFLFGVSPFDPMILAFSAAAMLLLALAASALPAMRAAATDPISALRGE